MFLFQCAQSTISRSWNIPAPASFFSISSLRSVTTMPTPAPTRSASNRSATAKSPIAAAILSSPAPWPQCARVPSLAWLWAFKTMAPTRRGTPRGSVPECSRGVPKPGEHWGLLLKKVRGSPAWGSLAFLVGEGRNHAAYAPCCGSYTHPCDGNGRIAVSPPHGERSTVACRPGSSRSLRMPWAQDLTLGSVTTGGRVAVAKLLRLRGGRKGVQVAPGPA